jgi:hypothetical protein
VFESCNDPLFHNCISKRARKRLVLHCVRSTLSFAEIGQFKICRGCAIWWDQICKAPSRTRNMRVSIVLVVALGVIPIVQSLLTVTSHSRCRCHQFLGNEGPFLPFTGARSGGIGPSVQRNALSVVCLASRKTSPELPLRMESVWVELYMNGESLEATFYTNDNNELSDCSISSSSFYWHQSQCSVLQLHRAYSSRCCTASTPCRFQA